VGIRTVALHAVLILGGLLVVIDVCLLFPSVLVSALRPTFHLDVGAGWNGWVGVVVDQLFWVWSVATGFPTLASHPDPDCGCYGSIPR